MKAHIRPEQIKSLPQGGEIQNGNTGNYQNIPPTRGVGHLYRPIQEQSRKYLKFHVQGQTYQFKALPFGLSTAPLEFTVVAKEVKLMAIHKGIRIHQYLDDWWLPTSLCTYFRTGSYSPASLMVTGQPLLINWETHPSTLARTKISLVSWTVSIETDPKAGGASPPGTSHWFCTS